jgi:hypothetical protein
VNVANVVHGAFDGLEGNIFGTEFVHNFVHPMDEPTVSAPMP